MSAKDSPAMIPQLEFCPEWHRPAETMQEEGKKQVVVSQCKCTTDGHINPLRFPARELSGTAGPLEITGQ